MKPIEICNNIKKGYINYLLSSFPIGHEHLRTQFQEVIKNSEKGFFNGPILVASPEYKKGRSITELMLGGGLEKDFSKKQFNPNRPLYVHQEKALSKIVNGRNIVITTGTGSGKTEAFFFPVLNYLLKERREGRLKKEVYAMIMYPMNALVNDQLERLREYLNSYPEITFGRYTGETEETYKEALNKYKHQWGGSSPLSNELISREQIKASPPNILITNYSMLERLLLRPNDSNLFNGDSWKYIVLDEAHIYDGAVGQECSLLLRRLKDRVGREKTKFQCIATSATLGKGPVDYPDIALFASDLFGEQFLAEDVVNAEYEATTILIEENVTMNPSKYYCDLAKHIDSINILKDKEIYLYEKLISDKHINEIKNTLPKKGFLTIAELKAITQLNEVEIEQLIGLAIQAKDSNGRKLLPAKYHFFIRAMEGLYLFYTNKEQQLFIKPTRTYDGKNVFELGVCQACKSLYLLGHVVVDGEKKYLHQLKQSKEIDQSTDRDDERDQYYAIVDQEFYKNDQIMLNRLQYPDEDISYIPTHKVCTSCGRIVENTKDVAYKFCECDSPSILSLKSVEKKNTCAICGATSSQQNIRKISPFSTGRFAPTYAIAKYFYDKLPAIQEKLNDELLSILNQGKRDLSGKRKMLSFSDNRQDAAIFAANVEENVNHFFYRAYLYTQFNNYQSPNDIDAATFIRKVINDYKQYTDGDVEELKRHFIIEILRSNYVSSLESNCLWGYAYDLAISDEILKKLAEHMMINLDVDEFRNLLYLILDSVRYDHAIKLEHDLYINYSEIAPQVSQKTQWPYITNQKDASNVKRSWYAYCYDDEKKAKDIKYFNLRKDIIFNKILKTHPISEKNEVLDNLYKILKEKALIDEKGQLSLGKINIIQPKHWYKCNKCGAITYRNIRNICFEKGCNGVLENIPDIDEYNNENQYYLLNKEALQGLPPLLKAEEHTAQLAKDYAANLQNKFKQGKINLLSSSTTFEMGVDLAELNAVLLRNMPPSPANYIQRSGRAGRNNTSGALIVTYCQRRAHDFNYFSNPERMLRGVVKVPKIDVSNEKINTRHFYAIALGIFFNKEAHALFAQSNEGKTFAFVDGGYHNELLKYLNKHPEEIIKSANNVFSNEKQRKVLEYFKSWSWIRDLYSEDPREASIMNAVQIYKTNIDYYNEKMEEAKRNNNGNDLNHFYKVIKYYKSISIVDFMVNNGILPKYGFPTDVVKVFLEYASDLDAEVELTRAMRTAISEYAPNNEIIAAKKIYKITGIKKFREKDLPKTTYVLCKKCGRYYDNEIEKILPEKCKDCGGELNKKDYITPNFGFVCAEKPKNARGQSPEKHSFTDAEYFAGPHNMQFEEISTKYDAYYTSNGSIVYINSNKKRGFSFDQDGKIINKMGIFNKVNIGCKFNTDILAIVPKDKNIYKNIIRKYWNVNIEGDVEAEKSFWLSVMYAIINAGCELLSIGDRDVNGLITYINNSPAMVIYDTLPGGAGFSNRIRKNFLEIVQASKSRLEACKCGGAERNTSCYSCLRGYLNQKYHDRLIRGAVLEYLEINV